MAPSWSIVQRIIELSTSYVFTPDPSCPGTARPNSVSQESDPWLHELLGYVRELSGIEHGGVLINTSLNLKGMPICSSMAEALLIFCAPGGEELDFVLLEERFIFERRLVQSRGLCRSHPTWAHSSLSPRCC